MYDQSTRTGDDYTPEVSAFASQTFFDDTRGHCAVRVPFRSDTTANLQAATPNGWSETAVVFRITASTSNIPGAGRSGRPATATNGLSARRVGTHPYQRSADAAVATLLIASTATLDYTMAQLELDHRYNNMSVWFSPTGQSGTWTRRTPLYPPWSIPKTDNQPDRPMGAGIDASKNTRSSIGFNVEWDATDRLRFERRLPRFHRRA